MKKKNTIISYFQYKYFHMSPIWSFFGRKEGLHCLKCNKELTRYKYKPPKDANLEGFLCGDCHLELTKESIIRENVEKENFKNQQVNEKEICSVCNREVPESEIERPKWQWNMERGAVFCSSCFHIKEKQFEIERNFCSVCGKSLKFFRYNPKQSWNIIGQLCRKCWDEKNSKNGMKKTD